MRDLRRLIEMYQRWQLRVFPGITFDEYIAKLEAMSSSMVLRVRRGGCVGPGWGRF